MNIREWALVAFTLLMQASVGIVVAVVLLQATGAKTPSPARPAPFEAPIVIALVTAAAALAASLLHLGQPLQAWQALLNLRTSWLSREVLLAGLYVAAVAAYALLAGRRPFGGATLATAWVAAILGCAAVVAMCRLYMVPAQPVWNRALTPVGFATTTLVLGATLVIALGSNPASFGIAPSVLRRIGYAALVLVAVQAMLLPALVAALPQEPAAALAAIPLGAARLLAGIAGLAALGAVAILAFSLRQAPTPALLVRPSAAITLLVLVAVASIAGRMLFYAAAVELRAP